MIYRRNKPSEFSLVLLLLQGVSNPLISTSWPYLKIKKNMRVPKLAIIIFLIIFSLSTSAYADAIYVLGTFDKQTSDHISQLSKVYAIEQQNVKGPNKVQREPHKKLLIAPAKAVAGLGNKDYERFISQVKSGLLNILIIYDYQSGETVAKLPEIKSQKLNLQTGVISFSNVCEELRELKGVQLAITFKYEPVILIDKEKKWQCLARIHDSSNAADGAWILKKTIGSGAIYLTTATFMEMVRKDELFKNIPSILPFIIAIKNSYGERIWHRKFNMANLTIDDPWLREPYGNLSYSALLAEMEKVNFHTTIAFVPWNYKRSESRVVDLFLKNRNRFSICIHGNNHDISEFHDYSKHPLEEQKSDIKYALARMEKFKELTGIDYSRVMVFPRGIAPVNTMEYLKKNDFSCSVNSRITPLGSDDAYSIYEVILPALLRYYNFPLLKRYSVASVDRNIIALMMYFEKPILVYTHQELFADRMGLISDLAGYVNQASSVKLEWTDLARVAEGLYMEKLGKNGMYDIWMLSRKIKIRNDSNKIKKISSLNTKEDLANIEKLSIGDKLYNSGINKELRTPRVIKPGESLSVELVLKGSIKNIDQNELGDFSIKNRLIRAISDSRDIYLSRTKIGRAIIDWYYSIN